MIDINFVGKFCNFGPLIFVISAACRSCHATRRLKFVDLPYTASTPYISHTKWHSLRYQGIGGGFAYIPIYFFLCFSTIFEKKIEAFLASFFVLKSNV